MQARNSISLSSIYILSLVCTFLCVLYVTSDGLNNYTYLLLFSVNCFLTTWNIFDIKGMPYSLKMLVNFYILIFLILANAIQYASPLKVTIITLNCPFSSWDYIHFQFVVFFIIIFFNYFYITTPRFNQDKLYNKDIQKKIQLSNKKLLITGILFTGIILIKFNFDMFELFLRGATDEYKAVNGIETVVSYDSKTSLLIFSKFIRPIPWASLLLALIYDVKNSTKIILFFCTIITVFPTGLARNAAAMFWIPIFLILFNKRINGLQFVIVMILGIFLIFPLLDNFRYFTGLSNINFKFDLEYLNTMNFDGSQMMMATIKTDTITLGYQLLGVIFFFVPRSLWATKPEGSGHYLVHENNGGFSNLSMPYFSEGYINFGYIGVFVFIIFIAWFSKKMDTFFWKFQIEDYRRGIYYVLLAAMTFVMRGDLMSSFSYTLAICVSIWMVYLITRISKNSLNIK